MLGSKAAGCKEVDKVTLTIEGLCKLLDAARDEGIEAGRSTSKPSSPFSDIFDDLPRSGMNRKFPF